MDEKSFKNFLSFVPYSMRKVIGPASLFIRWMVARAYARCSKLPTTYGAARGEKGKPL